MGQAVLDPQSGHQVYYPDGMSSDEIEHSMSNFSNGSISEYKPSWYDTYIKEPLQKMGASIYDPVMSAKAFGAGVMEGLRPMIPDKPVETTGKSLAPLTFEDKSGAIAPSPAEQQMYQKVSPMAYNLGNFGGSAVPLVASVAATEGLSTAVEGIPAIAKALQGVNALVKGGTLSEEGVATGAAALKGAVAFGNAGALQSSSKQLETYGNVDWHQVAKDTASQAGFGLVAGGVFGYLAKPLEAIAPDDLIAHSSKIMMASGTLMAAQVKMNGGSNRDALLAFGGGALLAGLGLHGEIGAFRESTMKELTDLKARYFVSQTGAEDTAAMQAMTEHTQNDAEQVIGEENQKLMQQKPIPQEQRVGLTKPISDPTDARNHLVQWFSPHVLARMDDEYVTWLSNQPVKSLDNWAEQQKEVDWDKAIQDDYLQKSRSDIIEDDAKRARGIPVDKTAVDKVSNSKVLTTNLVTKTVNEVTGVKSEGEQTATRGEVSKEESNAEKSGTQTGSGSEKEGTEGKARAGVRVRDDDDEGVVKEGKVAKSSEDISKELANRGMANLSEEDKAHFESTSYKGKTEELSELMRTDPMKAEKIATGEEDSSLSPSEKQLLFNMVKLKAFDEDNAELGIKLARSPLNVERSEAAKTLGASGFDNGDFGKEIDPIKEIAEVNKARNPETSKTMAAKINKALKEGIERVKKESVPKQSDFEKFMSQLRC